MGKQILNYYGDDADTRKWMEKADDYIREIIRLRNSPENTIRADDRLAIMEAIWLWDNAYDALERQTFLDLMTDDVYFLGNAWGQVTGKQAMGSWWDEFVKTFTGKRHNISNYIVAGNDTDAHALSYLTVVERVKHTSVVGTAIYFDRFIKQDRKWLIKERYQILDPGMNETAYGQELYRTYLSNKQA